MVMVAEGDWSRPWLTRASVGGGHWARARSSGDGGLRRNSYAGRVGRRRQLDLEVQSRTVIEHLRLDPEDAGATGDIAPRLLRQPREAPNPGGLERLVVGLAA